MVIKHEKDRKILTDYKRVPREPVKGDRSGMRYD